MCSDCSTAFLVTESPQHDLCALIRDWTTHTCGSQCRHGTASSVVHCLFSGRSSPCHYSVCIRNIELYVRILLNISVVCLSFLRLNTSLAEMRIRTFNCSLSLFILKYISNVAALVGHNCATIKSIATPVIESPGRLSYPMN